MEHSNFDTRVKVLYEMAMAIGNTLDEKTLLNDCLKVILRKLNGVVISFYDHDSQQALASLPRRGVKPETHNRLISVISSESTRLLTSGFVKSWQTDDGHVQYVFKISQLGWLTLVSVQPINDLTLNSLGPICDKLAASIRALQ